MNCSNCEKPPSDANYISVVQNNKLVAVLCSECQETVITAKIVLKRAKPTDQFVFEQYLPVECAKS